MRFFILGAFIYLSAGTTAATPSTHSLDINMSQAADLKIGRDTQKEIEAKLGAKKKIESAGDQILWTYYEPNHQFQRLTLAFDNGGILKWVLWVPHANDKELKLEFLKNRFPELALDPNSDPYENPHDADGRLIYRDEKRGLSLTYHSGRNEVEGLVWYDPNDRKQAASRTKRKYTL